MKTTFVHYVLRKFGADLYVIDKPNQISFTGAITEATPFSSEKDAYDRAITISGGRFAIEKITTTITTESVLNPEATKYAPRLV